MQDPYATTLGGFSKVTNFFRGALRPPDSSMRSSHDSSSPHAADDEPGFELITPVSERERGIENEREGKEREGLPTSCWGKLGRVVTSVKSFS